PTINGRNQGNYEMQSLEDLLNSSGPAPQANPASQADVTAQPAPPEPEAEDPPQEATDPATGEPEVNPSEAAPPAAHVDGPLDKKISACQRKAEDETRKRQEYEKQLQEARTALAERDRYIEQVRQWQAQQQQQGQEPEIDLLDPQQAQQYFGNLLAQERSKIAETLLEQKVVASQEAMRQWREDYDEHETIFAEEMKRMEAAGDHTLRRRLNAHPFPAKFAYEEGKRLKLQQELSDPDAYRAKLREEIMAELQSQQQPAATSQPQTQARPVPQPPKSLAGVRSASRDPIKHPWKGPTPLDQSVG